MIYLFYSLLVMDQLGIERENELCVCMTPSPIGE